MGTNATAAPPSWGVTADPVIAYAEWRMSSAFVRTAYRQWSNGPRTDAHLAYAATRLRLIAKTRLRASIRD